MSSYGCPVLFLPMLSTYLILFAFSCVSSAVPVAATRTKLPTYPVVRLIVNLSARAALFSLVRILGVIGTAFCTTSNIAIPQSPDSFSSPHHVALP